MLRIVTLFACLMAATAPAHATVAIVNAKVTMAEAWGGIFTVYLTATHTATACGHNASFAVDATTEAGKAMISMLLTAWATDKTVYAFVDDGMCLGDRPSVRNFYVL